MTRRAVCVVDLGFYRRVEPPRYQDSRTWLWLSLHTFTMVQEHPTVIPGA